MFERVTTEMLTFEKQANWWLDGIEAGKIVGKRKREPMKPATIAGYRAAVNWLVDPKKGGIANEVLADFKNDKAKDLVQRMKSVGLQPKTQVSYFQVVAAVIASATREGDQLFPRKWNLVHIALPKIDSKKQATPSISTTEVETVLSKASGQYQALYALLAGSGLRIGEVLGLRIEHLLNDCQTLLVEQSVWHGQEQAPKTESAHREVDICSTLAGMLKAHVSGRTKGFVFHTSSGRPLSARNIERDSLGPILTEMKAKADGKLFHSFRRFRSEHLEKAEVPFTLQKYWMGHASADITDRYKKGLLRDVKWRREVAEQAGLGFTLPTIPDGQLGQPQIVETCVSVAV